MAMTMQIASLWLSPPADALHAEGRRDLEESRIGLGSSALLGLKPELS